MTKNLSVKLIFKEKFGPWAIITGASPGIGKEFARQIAASGINVILLARRENLLRELAESLKAEYKVFAKYARIDLTEEDFLDQIETLTEGLHIGLAISNTAQQNL